MRDCVVSITDVDIRLAPGPWPMPQALRASVPERWAAMRAANPHLWEGRILSVAGVEVDEQAVLRGTALEDAYSAFLTWREAGFPDIGLRNLFGSALILTSDGFLLLGKMGGHTANAGRVYPPGGSLEPRDVQSNGAVDVFGSIALEITEETGLTIDEARLGQRVAIFDGPRISVGQALHFAEDRHTLVARIRQTLDAQEHRELDDVVPVRTVADAEAAGEVPPYVRLLLDALSSGRLAL